MTAVPTNEAAQGSRSGSVRLGSDLLGSGFADFASFCSTSECTESPDLNRSPQSSRRAEEGAAGRMRAGVPRNEAARESRWRSARFGSGFADFASFCSNPQGTENPESNRSPQSSRRAEEGGGRLAAVPRNEAAHESGFGSVRLGSDRALRTLRSSVRPLPHRGGRTAGEGAGIGSLARKLRDDRPG
jgi:hypothetical protein